VTPWATRLTPQVRSGILAWIMDDDDPGDSTLLRKGKVAFTLADMAAFAANLAARPIERIVALAVGKRMRASDAERKSLQERLRSLEAKADGLVRERCQALLKSPA
jgi:hypothetical protein